MLRDTIKVHRVFGEGLAWFVARPWFWIGTIVFFIVISVIVEMISLIFSNELGPSIGSESIAYALGIVCFLLEVFVYIRMRMGLAWMTVSTINGKSMQIGDLFAKSHLFWRFLFGTILYHLMCLAGFILFFVPGIYLAVRFFPFNLVLIERETGILDSFRQAQKLTRGNRGKVFAFVLLCAAIMSLLMLPFMVMWAEILAKMIFPLAMPGEFELVPVHIGLGLFLVAVLVTPIILLSEGALYWALRNATTDQTASA